MNRSKLSIMIASVGFAVVAASVVMAFLADHHWLVTYQIALLFESTMWWVQLAGVALAVIGCVAMSVCLTQRVASRAGVAFIAAGLLLALLFGTGLLNIHDWMISLLLPVLLLLVAGTIVLLPICGRTNPLPSGLTRGCRWG
jgi:hypothetical protein